MSDEIEQKQTTHNTENTFDTLNFHDEILKDDIALLKNIGKHVSESEIQARQLAAKDSKSNQSHHQSPDKYDEEDDYYEDDDAEDDEPEYNFKFYDLSELEEFNQEIAESGIYTNSWWKSIKTLLNKDGLVALGIIITKVNKLTDSCDFDGIIIKDKNKSLAALEIFELTLKTAYKKQRNPTLAGLVFFIGLLWYYPNSIILYLMIAWQLYYWFSKYKDFQKIKIWVSSARNYIHEAPETDIINEDAEEKNKSDTLESVVSFTRYANEQESQEWTVKTFDWFANLIKGKK